LLAVASNPPQRRQTAVRIWPGAGGSAG